MRALIVAALLPLLTPTAEAFAFDLCLPTANDALLQPGRDDAFFQPTVEGTVESGMFGCVRSDGRRFHEGVDIKCLQRNRRGEPLDPVHAAAAGRVAFINTKPGRSNYGRYVVIEHNWDGVQVFTLYAHLSAIAAGLATGLEVQKAQVIATLGHSTNTRERIPASRAHLHFEINFMLNPHFRLWYPKRDPKAPPLGNFNGQNFIGLDPAALLREFAGNPKLNFADYIAQLPVAFTVLASGREIAATAWGLPVKIEPRAAASTTVRVVNETELSRANCRGLLRQGKRGWELTDRGREWLELLTYAP